MIPVELRLENFLSYGEDAPALAFDRFQVACLSGGNGQGKSALLDAMTWALWGEARKGSGARKPDDDLLRIGALQMRVEFTFDLEGDRYRVVRGYRRSASGKSSRPELEFQILEEDSGEYRALSGASVTDTQRRISAVLGLDYETFINSAFLLQGRSDEFTRKNATDRKHILARILNLGRYDRLAALARERFRAVQQELEGLQAELTRLDGLLSEEPTLRAELKRLEAEVQAIEEQSAAVDERLEELRKKRAGYAAYEMRRTTYREHAAELEKELVTLESGLEEARARWDAAQSLIAQADQIRAATEAHEQMEAEVPVLEEQHALYEGLTSQISTLEAKRDQKRFEIEKRLQALEGEQRSARQRLGDALHLMTRADAIREGHKRAETAARQLAELEKVALAHEQCIAESEAARKALDAERVRIETRITTLEDELRRREMPAGGRTALQEKVDLLERRLETVEQTTTEKKAIAEQGQRISGILEARSAQLSEWGDALERLREQIAAVAGQEQGRCPTCGTDLTESHRRQVLGQLREEELELGERLSALRSWIDEQEKKRSSLRERYRVLHQQTNEADDLRKELGEARHRLMTADQTRDRAAEQRELLAVLQTQLQEEAFGLAHREALADIERRRGELEFDPEHFRQLTREASVLAHARREYENLTQAEALSSELERQVARREEEIATTRAAIEAVVGPVLQQIKDLHRQRDELQFDRGRLDRLRRELKRSADVKRRLYRLEQAEEKAEILQADVARFKEAMATRQARRAGLDEQLAELERELEGLDELDRELAARQTDRADLEEQLAAARLNLGRAMERVSVLKEQRKVYREHRARVKEARSRKSRYGHLRTAFSKHGIPSLIIEETLPEIEHRSNDVLQRLTDGRTQIRLETLRDKKSGGGTKETLDIKITDELGVPRAYETFSGGEGFRVNFALRIALAQMLAARSGVRVQTLVIDEGFGTQDPEGIQQLVQAIDAVRTDFAKILVITHLKELKEAFAVRIEVHKDAVTGSTFEIVGAP